jgi:hypothetical protein
VVQAQKQPLYSAADLERAAAGAVDDSRIMNPDLPSANVAELAFEELERPLAREMGRALIVKDFIARDRRSQAAARREDRERQFELAFASPDLREILKALPARLRKPKTELSDYREFVKAQNAKVRERHETNPATVAAKKLIDAWPIPPGKSRRPKSMTIAEVDALKSREVTDKE